MEDEERFGAPAKFEDEELESSLDEDPSQTQEKLAKIRVTQPEMEMIPKVGNWMLYELKLRDIECHFLTCEENYFNQKKKKKKRVSALNCD